LRLLAEADVLIPQLPPWRGGSAGPWR
jgi:hypothetical protein